jgi:hypothetical protein
VSSNGLTKLCDLWKRTGMRGKNTYLSGDINRTSRLVVFENHNKTSIAAPDYHVFIRSVGDEPEEPE